MMKRGTTLMELVVYIAILTMTIVFVTFSIVQLSQTYGKARSEQRVAEAADTALERIVRELRLACSVTTFSGTSITLDTFADFSSATACPGGTSRTIAYASNKITIAGADLTAPDVTVTAFDFDQLSGTVSNGIRVTMTVESGRGKYYVTRSYSALAILRGSY